MPMVGTAYTVPEVPHVVMNENAGWRFAFDPKGTPQAAAFDDASWTSLSLPHTWNNIDGASTNYASGDGWYRKTITVDASVSGKKLYLEFEGGSMATSLFIDGAQVDYKPSTPAADAHLGGFGDFLFDVTTQLTPGPHVIAVRVNNATDKAVAPAGNGDYSKEGGLYRDVSLLALPLTRIARAETVTHPGLTVKDAAAPVSTPGVYFTHSAVKTGTASATVNVRTVLDNDKNTPQGVKVISYLVDATGIVQAEQTSVQTLAAGQAGVSVVQATTLNQPHLWNGRIDPYLYDLHVEIRDGATNALLDATHKKVGIRSFTVNVNAANDANIAPFELNGQRYTLVGANAHQDSGRRDEKGNPVGWAQSDAQIRADVDMLMEAGATIIRTSHYQHNQAFYDYCDQVGMLVYTESPINGNVTPGDGFMANAQDQYQELARQTFNNPSVFSWGFGNETAGSDAGTAVFRQLNVISHALDPSRKSGFAQYGGSRSTGDNLDGVSDIKGTHRYDGWYIGFEGTKAVQDVLNAYPTQPLAVTEIGSGASAYQYADAFTLPVSANPGGVRTHFHPANQQALINAMQMTQYAPLHNLWARVVWQAFDHASVGKNEGDQGGINDKGLTTRDRVPKDAFYYFSALWNDPARGYANRKIMHVADQHWTVRNQPATKVTAYSNIGPPTLFLNGISQGEMKPLTVTLTDGEKTVDNTYVLDVTLPVGNNAILASRAYGDGVTYTNTAQFAYYDAATFAKGRVIASAVAVNRTFDYSPVFKTTSNPFEYELANGLYDVRITSPAGGVNNLSLEGQTAAIDSNGLAGADTFYARVDVQDGHLTLAGAPGAVDAAVTSIDISAAEGVAPNAAIPTTNPAHGTIAGGTPAASGGDMLRRRDPASK